MIDYKEAKKYLLPTLLDYGFKERKDKSCKSCLVFSDGSETLLVYRNQGGVYDHYVNKSTSDDYGDAVHFIMKRVLNKTTNLSAEDFCKVEAELSRIAGLGVIKDVINNTSTIQEKQPFDISKYTVERLDLAAVPGACRRFFEQRHIDPGQLAPFKSVIGILVSDRGFKQPLFYWQNMDGNIVGAQYKYIKDNVCQKRFLKNTDRSNSLWMTPIEGSKALFVTEDPLDAIAHSQLFPGARYAYFCTGGTSTKAQREMIHSFSQKFKLPIILGNDNDLAGQLENFKLALHTANIEYAITSKTSRVLLTVNGAEREWGKDEIVAALQAVMKQRPNIILSIPWAKDWNDDLRSSKKSISLRIAENMARVQIETTKSEQRGVIAGKLP